jgi:hypothetical protein
LSLQYSVFHCTFTEIFGYHYKLRVPLDLAHHIREETYNPDQGGSENEKWLRILEDNSSIRDKNRPKWEIVLLHYRKEHQTQSTLIFKMNHGLVDSHSVRILFHKLFNQCGPVANLYKHRAPEAIDVFGMVNNKICLEIVGTWFASKFSQMV